MTAEPDAFASVVGGPDALAAADRALRSAAWVPRSGWALPAQPWSLRLSRVVCLGSVADAADAEAALVACARTAGVVVDVGRCPADLRAAFVDDLARLALGQPPVRRQASARLPLTPEQRALLSLVAGGASVPEAADQLYLSTRTAERRMASVRKALGVASTAAAVARLLAEDTASGGLRGTARTEPSVASGT